MKQFYNSTAFYLSFLTLAGGPLASQAQYTPGNLVVLQVGDGSVSLSSAAAPTALAEYTPTGSPVGTPVLLNNSDPGNKLTNAGNSGSEGMITLSANGQYLLTAGYNAAVGTAGVGTSSASTVGRSVAVIDGNRSVDLSTVLPDAFTSNSIRGAASPDGKLLFLSGASSSTGLRYANQGAGSSASSTSSVTNARVVRVVGGQVYFTTSAGSTQGIYLLGPATATSGQTATPFLVTGSTASASSPYGFVLFDRDANVPGPDAAYVADDSKGILKWVYDGTSWTTTGTINTPARGLTGTLNPDGSATLYATTRTSSGGNALVTVTDTSPSTAAPSATASTTLYTAPANVALRGVDFAPGTPVVLPVVLAAFGATRTLAGPVALAWTTASELRSARFEVERSADGRAFEKVATLAAQGSSAQAHHYAWHDAAAPTTRLHYRLRQLDQDGTVAYSPTLAVAATSASPLPLSLSPNPAHEQLALTTEVPTPYVVRSTQGRVVLAGTTAAGATRLAIAPLAPGVYLLELQTSAGRVVQRFVKE